MYRFILRWLAIFLLMPVLALAADPQLRDGHPERYVVVRGDTLWDIADRFLTQPWLWPEIWYANPQIDNPHLIYPGDTIFLVYVDGRPQLRLERGHRTVKLSPQIRATDLNNAIPTIPIDVIKQFLSESLVLTAAELASAPYLVSVASEHVMGAAGDSVYVRAIHDEQPDLFTVVRPGQEYLDPVSGESLGFEALFIGDGKLQRVGDPAKVFLTRSKREALAGDRLVPSTEEEILRNFVPSLPPDGARGQIISVMDGVTQIGQYQVVVLNLGQREGMEAGHVMAVDRKGGLIRDTVSSNPREVVQLPDELSGYLMVFRTFEKVSYALIMKASRAMHVNDVVRMP